jgi:scyllo-inositol 2-dehydrogenase (NADP+)
MGERREALVRGELGRGGGELATGSCLRHPGCTRRRLLASEAVGTPDALSVAIVGYGLAGSVFHAPLVTATPGLRLASVVTGDAGRADAARSAYPGVRILRNADEVFASPDVTDLVVIAAPNVAHVPLARRAVAAGLPVVVDKPIATTAADAAAVAREAESVGVLLTVFQNRRFDDDFRTLQAVLDGGTLGAVVRVESRFDRYRPAVQEGRWRESADPALGGGLLLDLGAHLVDQAVTLFGAPDAVYAEVERVRPGAAVDDDVFVALRYADRPRVHLWATMAARRPGPRFRVAGLGGTFEVHGLDPQEDALRAGARPGAPGWGVSARQGTLLADVGGVAVTADVELLPGAYERFYAGVRDAVRDGAPPPVDPWDAVLGLRILEASRLSAARGAVVPLAEVPV